MGIFTYLIRAVYTPYFVAFLPLILWLLYRHFTGTFDIWKKKGIPYVKPIVFFGNIKDRMFFKLSFHEFYLEIYRKLEGHPVGGMFEGRRAKLLLRDPEIIRQVMVRDFEHFTDRPTLNIPNQDPHVANLLLNLKGRKWKIVRSLMTPAFTSGKIKAMIQMVDKVAMQLTMFLGKRDELERERQSKSKHKLVVENDTTKDTSGAIDGALGNRKELEMKDLFGRYTFDVISSCAFGVQCDSLLNPEAEFVQIVSKFDYMTIWMRLLIFLVIMGNSWLLYFVTPEFLEPKAISFLVALLRKTKAEREGGKQEVRNDFLQLMIDAKSGGNSQVTGLENTKENDDNEFTPQKVLTEDVIIAQCLLFLLAGYETSSTLLTFAAYELALNPDIQEKVRDEVNTILDHHGSISNEALNDMTYLEMALLETLRKHPPVARIDRDCSKDYRLTFQGDEGEKTVLIEKGTPISIPVMGLHYDSKYFPEPYEFRPERFSVEEKAKRSPYVFQGFGHGPRNCLGMRFALMSTKLVMAHFLRDYRVCISPKTEVPYEYNKFAMLLKSKNGIWLNVEKIN